MVILSGLFPPCLFCSGYKSSYATALISPLLLPCGLRDFLWKGQRLEPLTLWSVGAGRLDDSLLWFPVCVYRSTLSSTLESFLLSLILSSE